MHGILMGIFLALYSTSLVACESLRLEQLADKLACINSKSVERGHLKECCEDPRILNEIFTDLFRCIFIISNRLSYLTEAISSFDTSLTQEIINIINDQLHSQLLACQIDTIESDLRQQELLICELVSAFDSLTKMLNTQLSESLSSLSDDIVVDESLNDSAVLVFATQSAHLNDRAFFSVEKAQAETVSFIDQSESSLLNVFATGFSQTERVITAINQTVTDQLSDAKLLVIKAFETDSALLQEISLQAALELKNAHTVSEIISSAAIQVDAALIKDFNTLLSIAQANQERLYASIDRIKNSCCCQDSKLSDALTKNQSTLVQSTERLLQELSKDKKTIMSFLGKSGDNFIDKVNQFGCCACERTNKIGKSLIADIDEQYKLLQVQASEQLFCLVDQLSCLQKVAIKETAEQIELLRPQIAGTCTTIGGRLSHLDKEICAADAQVLQQLKCIEMQLIGQLCLKLSSLESTRIVQKNSLLIESSDFQTHIINELCSKISSIETDLVVQNGMLRSRASCLDTSISRALLEGFGQVRSSLNAFNAAIFSKILTFQSGVSTTIDSSVSATLSELSTLNSLLKQKVDQLDSGAQSSLNQGFIALSGQLAARNALLCQKNASLEAMAISEVDFLCEKFSNASSDISFSLLQMSTTLLESIASLDTGITLSLLLISQLNGLVDTMQPGFLTFKYDPLVGAGLVALLSAGFNAMDAEVAANPSLASLQAALLNADFLAAVAIITVFSFLPPLI